MYAWDVPVQSPYDGAGLAKPALRQSLSRLSLVLLLWRVKRTNLQGNRSRYVSRSCCVTQHVSWPSQCSYVSTVQPG